jgi:kynureninase
MLTRDALEALDRDDPLSRFRDAFALPDGVIYLDGNSLGPLPTAVPARIQQTVTEEWGRDLITSWNRHDWIDLPAKVGDKIARLIGAGGGNTVCADGTSINLHKLLAAALPLRPGRDVILSDIGNFPTDLYIAQGLVARSDRHRLRLVEPDQVEAAIGADTAVVMLTQVDYRGGRKHDMARITEAAHRHGALMLWDLCHSAGAFPVDLLGAGADLAVGCGYKYLNGGPGAPAFLFVSPALQDRIKPPLSGWMGHQEPFAFDDDYRPADGILRNLCGTPSVIALSALDTALDVILDADMAALGEKSLRMSDLFMTLIESRCGDHGFDIITPRDPSARGSQVSFRHADGYAIVAALIDRGVIGDFRAPDVLRFGLAPLYLRFTDLWDAVEILRDIMARKVWDQPRYRIQSSVT